MRTYSNVLAACCGMVSLVGVSCQATTAHDGIAARAGMTPMPLRSIVPAESASELVGFPRFPALSPDGRTLVFSWAGDLWWARVPDAVERGGDGAVGLVAQRLTSHPAEETQAAFSPDGSMLAFESDRDGVRNLYVMPVRGTDESGGLIAGEVRRVTYSDAAQSLGSFSADGTSLLFSAAQEPTMYRQARLYRVSLADGQVRRITDAPGFLPRAGADGDSVIFARGSATNWNRPAYRGSAAIELYRYSMKDQTFTRLTTNDANDGNGFQTPDGSVVFVSSRDGQNNVWRLAAGASESHIGSAVGASKAATKLTEFVVGAGQVTIGHGAADLNVSNDGRRAVFVVWDTMYVLDLTKPGAMPVALAPSASGDVSESDQVRLALDKMVSEAALSPDGKTLAVIARGEVFVRSVDEGRPTRRVTKTYGRERSLAWSPDGRVLYFASDEPNGVYSIHAATVALTRDELEPKKPAEAPKPDEPKADEAKGASDVKPSESAAATGANTADPTKPGEAPNEADSGDKARAAKDEPKQEKVDHGKQWAESILFDVQPLVTVAGDDAQRPTPSPDGKKLAYVRGRGDIVVRDLLSGAERSVLGSWDEPEFIWAGDSRHMIYAVQDLDYNSDLWLTDTQSENTASSAINLTQHPDTDVSPRLSADGKVLTFLSERAGENGEFDVWQVYLDKKLEGLKGYELDEYFKKASESAAKRKPLAVAGDNKQSDAKPAEPKAEDPKKPEAKPPEAMVFDAADAYRRVRRLTSTPGSEGDLAVTPGADRIIYSATQDSDRALMSMDRKGEDKKVLQAGGVSQVDVSLTGEKVSFVRAGSANTAPAKGGKVETLNIDAPVTIDIASQQRQKFLEAARILGTRFYHSTMKGLDWNGLTNAYLSLAMQTRTTAEFNDVVAMLFGELNGSHTGISGGMGGGVATTTTRPNIGMLGVETEPVANGHRVTRVIAGSPADQPTSKLEVQDVIVGIDGVRLDAWPRAESAMRGVPDLSEALLGKSGKETLIEVERGGSAGTRRVLIVPVSAAALTNIGYEESITKRRELVETLSNGRLGYLHIRSMNEASVRDFERDLYAAGNGKDGLIIDVRDNGGGFTTDILLASLTAPVHAKTAPRGVDPSVVPSDAYPRDRRLIYAYTKPINVLINENSFSNAEVFSHAIKNIKRGALVGTATFGAVISTGSASLIDGTTVRVPGRGWWMPDGRDMENNGAEPDVDAPQTPTDDAMGRDAQIDAAVRELLGRLGTR